jgi:hypothetical protein
VSKVFVAGPFIDVDKDEEHPDNAGSESKKLRYFLCKNLEGPNITIYLGEDVSLRKNGAKHFGTLSNAVLYERHYIVNHLDAVILLPSSPGSFCETGDWAATESTCKKMLIILEKKYEGEVNYINEGIIKHATENGARAIYLDYSNRGIVLDACNDFISYRRSKKLAKSLYD